MEQEITTETPKRRHGCLLAFLIYMIVASTVLTTVNALNTADIQRIYPRLPLWGIWALPVMSMLNILFALLLFRWKKWGFFGYCLTSLIACGLQLYGGVGIAALSALLGIIILFAALQIGGENKGWSQLE